MCTLLLNTYTEDKAEFCLVEIPVLRLWTLKFCLDSVLNKDKGLYQYLRLTIQLLLFMLAVD